MTMIRKAEFLFICLVVVCGCMVGCKKDNDEKGNNSKIVYNKAAAEGDIKANKIVNDAILMTVGDIDVTYSEAMIYMLSTKQKYENMFSHNVWSYSFDKDSEKSGASFDALAKENIIKQISMLKILEQVSEDDLDLKLNKAEEIEAEDKAVEYLSKISMEDQEKYGLTKEVAIRFFKDNAIAEKIYNFLTMDVEEVSEEEARVVSLKQIEIPYGGKNKSKSEAKEKVEKIYEELKKTEDNFVKVALEESESDKVEVTIKRGEKEKEYEEAAYKLKKNQMSDIVETDKSYYILYCVVDNDKDKTKSNFDEMNRKRLNEAFVSNYNKWIKEYDLYVVSELWNKISFSTI